MSTYNDPLYNEDDEDEELEDQELEQNQIDFDAIEKLTTPAEIQAYKDALEEKMPKSIVETKVDNLDKTSLENKNDTVPEISKPEVTPAPKVDPAQTGQPQDKQELVLDDELLSRIPEADRKMFENFKGKPINEILKSYANAQRLVGKKQENLMASLQPTVVGQPQQIIDLPVVPAKQEIHIPEPQPTAVPLENGYAKTKEDYVTSQLRLKFSDFPTDPEEIKAYKANLNYEDPDTYFELREYERNVRTAVDEDFKKIDYVRNNYSEINVNLINTEIETINKYMKDKFNVELSQLGVDLKLDENNDNPIIRGLLFENDQVDKSLINDLYGVKLIKPNSLTLKFIDKNLGKILEYRDQQARVSGFEAANTKKPPKTLAANPTAGRQVKEIATIDDIENLTDLEQIRAQKSRVGSLIK